MAVEYTFSLIKRDAIARKLAGRVLSRFEEKGLDIIDLKWVLPTEEQIRLMYADKATESFFPELLAWMTGAPVIALVLQGEDAIDKVRQLIGEKLPEKSDAGTLRGSYAEDRIRSLVHGSRSPEEELNERLIFFPERWEGTPVPASERPPAQAPKFMADWWSSDEEEAVR